MLASQGNVILALLGIYSIFGFSTASVLSEKELRTIKKQLAFQKARCIADCHRDVSVLSYYLYTDRDFKSMVKRRFFLLDYSGE